MSRSKKVLLSLMLCAIVEAATTRVAPAYAVRPGSKWPQPGPCGANCPGSQVTLTYSFQNVFDGALKMPDGNPLPNWLIRGSIEEALRLWSSAAPLTFREVPDDGLPYGASTKFGDLRFRHVFINGPDPEIGPPVAKAQAYFPPGSGYPGDVEFDETDLWREVGTIHQPDILGAAIHEIGHSLGLDHTSVTQPGQFWTYKGLDQFGQPIDVQEPKGAANMYWIFNRLTGLGSGFLFQDDIDGIRSIYGLGSGSVISLVPEPTSLVLLLIAAATGCLLRRPAR